MKLTYFLILVISFSIIGCKSNDSETPTINDNVPDPTNVNLSGYQYTEAPSASFIDFDFPKRPKTGYGAFLSIKIDEYLTDKEFPSSFRLISHNQERNKQVEMVMVLVSENLLSANISIKELKDSHWSTVKSKHLGYIQKSYRVITIAFRDQSFRQSNNNIWEFAYGYEKSFDASQKLDIGYKFIPHTFNARVVGMNSHVQAKWLQ